MLLKLCKGLWVVLMLTGWVRLESSMMNNLLTSVCTAVSEIDLWHLLFKLQFNWTQQPVPNGVIWSQYVYLCYVWCHELTHWHRTPTTVCVTQVQLWILFKSSNSCTWRKIIDYKSFCTCCSLTFWQLHKLQSSHIKLFHIINSSTTCDCIWSRWKNLLQFAWLETSVMVNTPHKPMWNADPQSLCAMWDYTLHCSMMCCQWTTNWTAFSEVHHIRRPTTNIYCWEW